LPEVVNEDEGAEKEAKTGDLDLEAAEAEAPEVVEKH
jgi:hypothetical protein